MDEDQFPGCCGITVKFDFPDLDACDDEAERQEDISAVMDELTIAKSKIMMVALTDDQLKEGWFYVLRKLNYRRVARFRNGNTGNIINVYVGQHETNVPPPYKGKSKPKAKAKPRIGMTTTKR